MESSLGLSSVRSETTRCRFCLRHPLGPTVAKALLGLLVGILALVLLRYPLDLLGVPVALVSLLALYTAAFRRIYVDNFSIGFTTWQTAHLSFQKVPRQNIRKVSLKEGKLYLQDGFLKPLAVIPQGNFPKKELRLIAAAIPCYSRGLW